MEDAALAGENERLREELENSQEQLQAMEELTVSLTNESRVQRSDFENLRLLHGKEVIEIKTEHT